MAYTSNLLSIAPSAIVGFTSTSTHFNDLSWLLNKAFTFPISCNSLVHAYRLIYTPAFWPESPKRVTRSTPPLDVRFALLSALQLLWIQDTWEEFKSRTGF